MSSIPLTILVVSLLVIATFIAAWRASDWMLRSRERRMSLADIDPEPRPPVD